MARILVVEDTPHNMQLMTVLLESAGHEVVPAVTGEEGLDAAARAPVDLVVLDLQLPGVDGYEVLARLRRDALVPDTVPVVAVTALAMVGDRDRGLAAGFQGYLTKPIDPETFARAVEAHLPPELRGDEPRPVDGSPVGDAWRPAEVAERGVVLAVDDITVNVDLLARLLASRGFRVVGAGSLAEATEVLTTERPFLVLCDVHLGGGDGSDVVDAVGRMNRSEGPAVALLTASVAEHERAALRARSGVKVLPKPIDPQFMVDYVETVFAEAGV